MRLLPLLVLVLLLSACEGEAPPMAASVPVDRVLGTEPDPGFARARAPAVLQFPADHGPHDDFATEWWYLSGNLYTPGGRRFGYQFTLFRIGLRPGAPAADSRWRSNQIYMGHGAITDVAGGRHYSAQRLSRAALGLAGAVSQPLAIWLESWSLRGGGAPFPLALSAEAEDFGIALNLAAGEKPLILQGEQGLSRKSATPGNASYYYSFTRLPTTGTLRVGATNYRVSGESWLDHEWSSSALDDDQAGWDWFALQLDDGRELMFYRLRYRDGGMHPLQPGQPGAAGWQFPRPDAGARHAHAGALLESPGRRPLSGGMAAGGARGGPGPARAGGAGRPVAGSYGPLLGGGRGCHRQPHRQGLPRTERLHASHGDR